MSKNMNRRLFYMFLIRLTSDTEQPASDIQIRDFIKHIFIEIIEEGRKNTEGKAKVVAAGWERILQCSKVNVLKKRFGENIPFWRVRFGVHPFFQSIISAK